jgi:hypothetical protein
MRQPETPPRIKKTAPSQAKGQCVCGAVVLEIDVPAIWAWHDHSAASRHAQGSAYATYVGSWKSRFRILSGADGLTRYEDAETGTARSFCRRCGTPVMYERPRSPKIVNIPRALFSERTGRDTRYHMFMHERADWTWSGEPLVPLKGYPGVLWERPKRKKRRALEPMF